MDGIDYLQPDVPDALPWFDVPLVAATAENLEGYGTLVSDPESFELEIVTWPSSGWRPIDPGTGNEGGTTSGTFEFWWEGEILRGRNHAVEHEYVLGWATNPGLASMTSARPRERVVLWHANYHPDGGQLFFPLDGAPFVAPLALPGDDVKPDHFVAFYVDCGRGLYIHPNVWHEGVFPLTDKAQFYDEQGKVHARVSCNLAKEFGVFLSIPLRDPGVDAPGNSEH